MDDSFFIEYLRQKQDLTDLEKDILDSGKKEYIGSTVDGDGK